MDISNIFSVAEEELKPAVEEVYSLMLKDTPLLTVVGETVEVLDRGKLPLELRARSKVTVTNFKDWARDRTLPIQREHAKWLLNNLKLSQVDKWSIILACKGLSLIDCFWIKTDVNETWASVNFYSNTFSEAVGVVAFTGKSDMTIQGQFQTPELTGQGAYAKCWRREEDGIYLYKANTKYGFESEAEFLVSKLLEAAGVKHVTYELTTYEGRVSSKCKNLCDETLSIIPYAHFATFALLTGQNPLKLVRQYYAEEFSQMLVIDYLIDNIDRHGLNWGFLINTDTSAVLGLHPLCDHNCSLTFEKEHPVSLIYDGKTMEKVAKVHYLKLNDQSFVQKMLDYLNKKETKRLFKKLLNSESQWTQVKSRCEELLSK